LIPLSGFWSYSVSSHNQILWICTWLGPNGPAFQGISTNVGARQIVQMAIVGFSTLDFPHAWKIHLDMKFGRIGANFLWKEIQFSTHGQNFLPRYQISYPGSKLHAWVSKWKKWSQALACYITYLVTSFGYDIFRLITRSRNGSDLLPLQLHRHQVPILPNVTNICNLHFFIFVTFNQYSLVGQVFCNHFEPIF
jgi:hypothetical protein